MIEPIPELDDFAGYLRHWSQRRPDEPCYFFLRKDEEAERITFAGLDQRVRFLAGCLSRHCQPGDRVIIAVRPSIDYLALFLACLSGGFIAVTAFPPTADKSAPRVKGIVADCAPRLLVFSEADRVAIDGADLGTATQRVSIEELSATDSVSQAQARVGRDTIAFLQYTSGSTGAPRGVIVTHGNLIHNSRGIHGRFAHTTESRVVSWLPLYHDMGLIGGALQSLFGGFGSALMAPIDFLQSPVRWLRAITRYRATSSGAPNFAFQYCVDRIADKQLEGLDLSSWQVAYNGAENISRSTLHRFIERLRPFGLRGDVFLTCFGLAEATLLVTGSAMGRGHIAEQIAAEGLPRSQGVRAADDGLGRWVVSSGHGLEDQHVAIVDPETSTACPEGTSGEVWVAGASIAQGYWQNSQATEATFGGRLPGDDRRYLRTGDLGYLRNGELFVTGRLKDLIILKGSNHHPEDIEQRLIAAGGVGGISGVAAFSVLFDAEERLVVAQELDARHPPPALLTELVAKIRRHLVMEQGLSPLALFLLKPGTLPRTSSGKVRRHQCRGDLGALINPILHATDEFQPPRGVLAVSVVGHPLWLAKDIASKTSIEEIESCRPGT